MKIDRHIVTLDRCVATGDLVQARKIIESNLDYFLTPRIRNQLRLDSVALINSIVQMKEHGGGEVFSRETQLIVQHINKLAQDGKIIEIIRYAKHQAELLANPKVYALLSTNAKAILGNTPHTLQQAEYTK
ncbi:hypothetical protein [Kurthia massiliensis]|uniref:hypothetical protein n=1 Tax=Kurthia massiliensis TaxID=1033739 RepID=UPI000288F1C3|nr:hypothetical protein [Kurthia massiliensis]